MKTWASKDLLICLYFLNANCHEISFSFPLRGWEVTSKKEVEGSPQPSTPLLREFPRLYPVVIQATTSSTGGGFSIPQL